MKAISRIRFFRLRCFLKSMLFDNLKLIILGFLLVAGVLFGCIFSPDAIFSLNFGDTFRENFFSYLSSTMLFQLFFALSGTSFLGIAACPIILFSRGLGLGSAILSVYSSVAKSGSAWSLAIIIPHYTLFAIFAICSASITLNASVKLISAFRNEHDGDSIREIYKLFFISNLILCFATLISAAIYSFSVMFLQSVL